jgi:hypothetical protein
MADRHASVDGFESHGPTIDNRTTITRRYEMISKQTIAMIAIAGVVVVGSAVGIGVHASSVSSTTPTPQVTTSATSSPVPSDTPNPTVTPDPVVTPSDTPAPAPAPVVVAPAPAPAPLARQAAPAPAPVAVAPAPAPAPVVVTPPIRCPLGSTSQANDGTNDTACLPNVCMTISIPDPAHPECDAVFKP